MPKINVYVPDEMLEWIRANDIKYSSVFQERINEIRNEAFGEVEPRKVRRLTVRNGKIKLKPNQTPLGVVRNADGDYQVMVAE